MYCSRKCQHIALKRGDWRVCPQCGVEFYHTAMSGDIYCSQACYAKSMRGSFTHICQQCGKEFVTKKSAERQFCSWWCMHKHRRDRLVPFEDDIRRMYVDEHMTIYDIGEIFDVSGATIQDRLERMGVPRRTHNERTAFALHKRVGNSLEREMSAILSELGIKHKRQKTLGYYAFDFYLPDVNTLIECDGTFWHADPRFYPDKDRYYPVQKKTTDNDRRKTTYAVNKGFNLIRFWEYDVFNNREWVKACLLDLFR